LRGGEPAPVAGVDEAGRGPLAGPVLAAAVILPLGEAFPGLNDSKLLTAEERDRLAVVIRRSAIAVAVGAAGVEEIDSLNILRASHLAMARALQALHAGGFGPALALVDGLPARGLPCPHRAIPHGDALCVSIAAASVIAKVTRDAMMREMSLQYPGYGFERHKGYATRKHLAALAELGPCPIHRRSFRPVAAHLPVAAPHVGGSARRLRLEE
jgi:ribonuclease HII